MRILKSAIVVLAACSSLIAHATPDILKEFKALYNSKNADCITCHVKPPKRNAFGKEIEDALNQTNDGLLTKTVMETIEKKDADGDGVSNIDEINAGTLPGDPNSKPAPKAASENAPKAEKSELVPKHSFHPAIVHFPIALLAIAAFLEVLARRCKNDAFHAASYINLAIGLVMSVGAIATGVAAWLRLGYEIKDDLLIHLLLATASVLVGIVAYAQREKPTYYLPLIVVSGILVMAAGHFGGNMVYG